MASDLARKIAERLDSELRQSFDSENEVAKVAAIIREELAKVLPTTADNFPVFDEMVVYRVTRTTGNVEPHRVFMEARAINNQLAINVPIEGCYSTDAAARAAKEKA